MGHTIMIKGGKITAIDKYKSPWKYKVQFMFKPRGILIRWFSEVYSLRWKDRKGLCLRFLKGVQIV